LDADVIGGLGITGKLRDKPGTSGKGRR
jgi:hypothetical protein